MSDDTFHAIGLEALEETLASYVSNHAEMIYYHHRERKFMCFTTSDQALYREEMRNLKRNVRFGRISAISAGDTISIEGTNLFPMDLKVNGSLCYEYMMLRRRGRFEDADNTPYFFKSKKKRDEIIAYLMKSMP